MKNISLQLLIFVFLVIAPIDLSFGHPHVFIAQKLTIVFDKKGMAGIQVNWAFDEFFSSMIANDHDKNQNGILEPSDIQSIKEEAFSYIAEYHYFFSIKIENKPFSVNYVTEFNARLENGKLIYRFFIPCHVTATREYKKIIIASYDPNYYSGIYFAPKKPFGTENGSLFDVNASIKEDKSTSIYYDMVNPWALFLDFRIK